MMKTAFEIVTGKYGKTENETAKLRSSVSQSIKPQRLIGGTVCKEFESRNHVVTHTPLPFNYRV